MVFELYGSDVNRRVKEQIFNWMCLRSCTQSDVNIELHSSCSWSRMTQVLHQNLAGPGLSALNTIQTLMYLGYPLCFCGLM